MAMLDVDDAVLEPQFQSEYSVVRQLESVGDDGVGVITETVIGPLNGVVFSAGGSVLDRRAGFSVAPKTIQVCGTFFLRSLSEISGTTFQPDVVIWNGSRYLCHIVEDWSNYGRGFTYSTCVLMDNIATTPAEQP